jgi:hypothetical protein
MPFPISGKLIGPDGMPLQSTVRLYNLTTGALVDATTSDPITGNYTLNALIQAEHYIIALNDDTGIRHNDIVSKVDS